MSRIEETFARCKQEGRAALVTYVMGGDPDAKGSVQAALACARGGADLIEIGIPFSDPMADGPTIQRAAERSLKAGTTVEDCLKIATQVRKETQAPIALMGYLNPMLQYGYDRFLTACVRAGVDALIVPDLPPEEAGELVEKSRAKGVSVVFLLAPTSTEDRVEQVHRLASGFVYFVSVTGVTGARAELPPDLGERLEAVRRGSSVPVVVGFGVSSPEQVRELAAHADGVVVGSAIVNRFSGSGSLTARTEQVSKFVRGLRKALGPLPRSH
jgi:tryptophan synthase alpha chain